MSEEKTSQLNRKSHSSHAKFRKHHAVLPYIVTPLVFTMIALVFAFPVGKVALNYAVNTVHKAQSQLSIGFNDIQVTGVMNENNTQLENISLSPAEKLGTLSCESAGIYCDVYYGVNRVSLRQGAGLSSKYALIGSGDTVKIAGNVTSVFKNLGCVQIDDVITAQTAWGEYSYKVYDIQVQDKSTENQGDLVLSTPVDSTPFASYQQEQLYVYAYPVSEEAVQ